MTSRECGSDVAFEFGPLGLGLRDWELARLVSFVLFFLRMGAGEFKGAV